jgi:serine/threonine protein phosphatase PrpC
MPPMMGCQPWGTSMQREPGSPLWNLHEWLMRTTPTTGIRRVLPTLSSVGSDVGLVRHDNEDRVVISRGRDYQGNMYVLACLADGIGGMRDGAGCAALAVATLVTSVHGLLQIDGHPTDTLSESVLAAQRVVRETYGGSGGSTLVALLMTETSGTYWASIGDSRLYLFRGHELAQLSTDDTIAGQLGRRPDPDLDQGRLLQFVGMMGDLEFKVEALAALPGATALLTSDGVHFLSTSSDVMTQVVRHSPDVGATARRLTELAKWAGGPDNATLAVVALDFEEFEPAPLGQNLDVWDPYGDIRLIHTTKPQAEAASPRIIANVGPLSADPKRPQGNSPMRPQVEFQDVPAAPRSPSNSEAPAPMDAGQADTDAAGEDPSTSPAGAYDENEVRKEAPAKRRKKRRRDALAAAPPQVQLHFSAGDNEQ